MHTISCMFLIRYGTMSKCYMAYHGVTIDPQGYISMCCVDDGAAVEYHDRRFYDVVKIDDITDLGQWFADTYPNKVWSQNENASNCFPCMKCYNEKYKDISTTVKEIYDGKIKNGTAQWTQDESNPKIKYLEFTSSNICNQMCVMCSGRHSSMWLDYDEQFGHRKKRGLYKLTNESIEKIKRVVPTLDECYIKGGEPLSDQSNIAFMEYVSEVNPECKISLTTNFQGLLDRHIDIFKKVRSEIFVSVDGTNEVFNWIRGGDFKRVVNNMEKYYNETGNKVEIIVTVSIYNFFSLESIVEYFVDKEYVNHVHCHNVVSWPEWASPRTLPSDIFEEEIVNHMRLSHEHKRKTGWGNYFQELDSIHHNRSSIEEFHAYTNKMNLIRGFDIRDYVPQLNQL